MSTMLYLYFGGRNKETLATEVSKLYTSVQVHYEVTMKVKIFSSGYVLYSTY